MDGAHVIDIDQLIDSVTRGHGCLWGKSGDLKTIGPLIHRINSHIRNIHKAAYDPIMLVIGPYNHGMIPDAVGMRNTKYEFLDYVLGLNHEKSLIDYLEAMKELDKQVRKVYADDIYMERNEFLKMLLLDGCFLFVSLRGTEGSIFLVEESNMSNTEIHDISHIDKSMSVSSKEVTIDQDEVKLELQTGASNMAHEDSYLIDQLHSQDFWHDVLLLENQIPFFVITKINELVVSGSSTTSVLIENVVDLVESVLCCYPNAGFKLNRPKEFHHLLHLCHMYFRPCLGEVQTCEVKPTLLHNVLHLGSNLLSKFRERSLNEGQQAIQIASPWHRATEYKRAGIGFKKRTYSSENPHSLLDIVLCNGMIEIPGLTIDPNTQALFCNLIAFEQSCPQFGSYLSAYVVFLSSLVSMPDDVSLLTENGIIVHQLKSDTEVCDLFKEISECAAFNFEDAYYLKPLYHRIEAHYQSQRSSLRELFGTITSKINLLTERNDSDLPLITPHVVTP